MTVQGFLGNLKNSFGCKRNCNFFFLFVFQIWDMLLANSKFKIQKSPKSRFGGLIKTVSQVPEVPEKQ